MQQKLERTGQNHREFVSLSPRVLCLEESLEEIEVN